MTFLASSVMHRQPDLVTVMASIQPPAWILEIDLSEMQQIIES